MGKPRTVALAGAVCSWIVAGLLAVSGGSATAADADSGLLVFNDATGQLHTLDVNGALDLDNPFFQDLGTNGRRCVTCHQPETAWTITPANVRARFVQSHGTDPIFRNNDGSNCEGVNPRNIAERLDAYSLLLTRAVIRVGLDVPSGAEFTIDHVDDPLRCGPASNDASLYRRPLPSVNLRFLSAVMWDGRESSPTTDLITDLTHQANDATRGHAQAAADLTPDQARHIVGFETGLFTAQGRDNRAGSLSAAGARGGPVALSTLPFFIGINDPVGLNPTNVAFDAAAFSLFDAWAALTGSRLDPRLERRRAIARGQKIFNTKPITITGVAGINGQSFSSGVTLPSSFSGTCTVCHNTPNVGDHSVKAPLNLGTADPSRAPYLPVYTLKKVGSDDTVKTTDPGRAMITGKWNDIGKFKGPVLRGLVARAPYFHNGLAATLEEVVDFYDSRFNIGFTAQEKADLVAFLSAL
jgi:cytochrome c peroxidase